MEQWTSIDIRILMNTKPFGKTFNHSTNLLCYTSTKCVLHHLYRTKVGLQVAEKSKLYFFLGKLVNNNKIFNEYIGPRRSAFLACSTKKSPMPFYKNNAQFLKYYHKNKWITASVEHLMIGQSGLYRFHLLLYALLISVNSVSDSTVFASRQSSHISKLTLKVYLGTIYQFHSLSMCVCNMPPPSKAEEIMDSPFCPQRSKTRMKKFHNWSE